MKFLFSGIFAFLASGMMVNGVPHLACKTFLRDYEGKDMKIEPLANFPIERDLVGDWNEIRWDQKRREQASQ